MRRPDQTCSTTNVNRIRVFPTSIFPPRLYSSPVSSTTLALKVLLVTRKRLKRGETPVRAIDSFLTKNLSLRGPGIIALRKFIRPGHPKTSPEMTPRTKPWLRDRRCLHIPMSNEFNGSWKATETCSARHFFHLLNASFRSFHRFRQRTTIAPDYSKNRVVCNTTIRGYDASVAKVRRNDFFLF